MDVNKKNIFLWALYDFASSIVCVVFYLYFSQWLVVDKGVSDFWYNMLFAIGSALLLITAPILGGIADRTGGQKRYLNHITILTFVFFLATSFVALFISKSVFVAALFFMIANYLYQFSFVFYNSLLYRMGTRNTWVQISSMGETGYWAGQIVGLLITLPLATGAVYLIGETGRAQTFLPATVLFFIFALPMLFFYKIPKQEKSKEKINLMREYKSFWNNFLELVRVRDVGLFLLAYFLFDDAIITASTNFPIYLQNVFNVSDSIKSMMLLGILVASGVGAILSGWVAKKIGIKKTLMGVLAGWIIIFPLMATISYFPIFVALSCLMGVLFGSVWTVTRAAMTVLCPKEKLSFGFSFYTLAERASTFIGPLGWGFVIWAFSGFGIFKYKMALLLMTVFVAAGLYFLKKVRIADEEPEGVAGLQPIAE